MSTFIGVVHKAKVLPHKYMWHLLSVFNLTEKQRGQVLQFVPCGLDLSSLLTTQPDVHLRRILKVLAIEYNLGFYGLSDRLLHICIWYVHLLICKILLDLE